MSDENCKRNLTIITEDSRPIPYAEIVHQPLSVYRMRYKSENRKAYLKKKTKNGVQYPKVMIVNGEGPATLIVSCVNKTEPYYVHPHKLMGENCIHGVALFNINKGDTVFDLSEISIEPTLKSHTEDRILELIKYNVDPFNLGYDFDRKSIDLSCVRLCFQIYLRDSFETTEIIRDKYHILKPVVSQVISSTTNSLSVKETFYSNGSCNGGSDVIIFIKKLEKDQKILKAKFYDSHGWSSIVDIEDSKIHYQCALSFKAPKYPKKIDKEETVSIKLFVPFKSEEERDNDDEDSMEFNGQVSSSSVSSLDSRQLGQYESEEIKFVYYPSSSNSSLPSDLPTTNLDIINNQHGVDLNPSSIFSDQISTFDSTTFHQTTNVNCDFYDDNNLNYIRSRQAISNDQNIDLSDLIQNDSTMQFFQPSLNVLPNLNVDDIEKLVTIPSKNLFS